MILVTGSNGFVGSALCRTLDERGLAWRGAVRANPGPHQLAVGDLNGATDWRAALAGCACVVHLAARVHVMEDHAQDRLSLYRTVNVEASVNLARQAHAAGVKRFVFVSSIKVNGEATAGAPFRADDPPRPLDPYGVSKQEAEAALLAYGRASGLEVVVVRPPLVYGPGVKANFHSLLGLVARGWPLPFGRAANRRSMVALDNLVDLLIVCTVHPQAPGRVFLVSDGCDLSIAELVTLIGQAQGRPVRLLGVPPALLRGAAALVGKTAMIERLFGSLQVDIDSTRTTLGWEPPLTPREAIARTVGGQARRA